MSEVLVEQAGPVAVVTLNRPQRRNALSSGLLTALRGALAELDASQQTGAIVLTGAEAAELELRAHASWSGGSIDPAQVAGRRASVIDRGRSQA